MTEVPHYSLFLISFALTFSAVFLKSFQVKNMVGGQYWLMFLTALVLGAFEIIAPQVSVKGGLWLIISGSLGAGSAIVLGVKFHDVLFKTSKRIPTIPKSPRSFKRKLQ